MRANWKLVFQNYSECLHCPTIHPELSTVLPYQSGANDLTEGPFLGGYMEIKAPNESATMSGRACGRLVSRDLAGDDRQRAFYYTLMPNMLLSIHPDYVNYYLLTPVARRSDASWSRSGCSIRDTRADAAFNSAGRDRVLGRHQPPGLGHRASRASSASSSRRYEPGPYSPRESMPAAWDREYLRMMGALNEKRAVVPSVFVSVSMNAMIASRSAFEE